MQLDLEDRRDAGGDEPVCVSAGWTLDELMAAIVDRAPEALRRRVLLQSVDWERIDAAQVAAMMQALGEKKQAAPRWLLKGLLLAGHVAPEEAMGAAPGAYHVLNRLNHENGEATAVDLEALAGSDGVEAEVRRAIVARLASCGAEAEDRGMDARRLALAWWPHSPEALAPVRSKLASYVNELPTVDVRLTGFSTTSALAADLPHAFAGEGFKALVTQSDFGQAAATLLAPDTEAGAHVLLLDMDGLAQADWRESSSENRRRIMAAVEMLRGALAAYAQRAVSPLLVNTIPVPAAPALGMLDRRHGVGLRRIVDEVNDRLFEAAERHGHIIVVDADMALADVPLSRHCDPKLWFYGRMAYSAEAVRALATAFARAFNLVRRGPAKVLALDFDNTLWGGVYGDDGLERLACGEDYPGNAFRAFQQECLRLKRQGMLLTALSKNNADALGAFGRHPGMALREEDFSAARVNWRPKAENIRQLAAELNLGLDSFVFIDDSPHEREAMRRMAPEVRTPELPADPAQRPAWLRRLTCTWSVRLTQEDETRAEMYAINRRVEEAKASALDMGGYLTSLEQRLTVEIVTSATVGRVAQMHERTNQFNLTTRRFTEAEIAAYGGVGGRGMALLGKVADRFGDHGIVVAATAMVDGVDAEISTFLMSCRVIGREVETAFLGALLEALEKRGVKRVVGRYLPTAKNGIVREFFGAAGFEPVEGGDGETESATCWRFPLDEREIPQSKFVSVNVEI
jgi:FkbH-like protein